MNENLDITFRIIAILAQIFVGIALIVSARIIARSQISKSIQDAWNDFNKIVLSNEPLSNLIKDHWPDGSKISDLDIKKRYLQIFQLNIHEAEFLARGYGLFRSGDFHESDQDLLKPLLREAGVYDISQTRGFSKAFKEHCRKLNST